MEGAPLRTSQPEQMDEQRAAGPVGPEQPATPERPSPPEPKVYVASLSDYNNGVLFGQWINAAQEVEALAADIAAMLASAPTPGAEEWAIFDYEDFNGLDIGEWEDLPWLSRMALGIVEHGMAFAHWAQLAGREIQDLERFETAYLGEWPSATAYAEHLLEDFDLERSLDAVIPDSLRTYVKVDADGLGRDLVLSGDLAVVEGPADNGRTSVMIFDMRW